MIVKMFKAQKQTHRFNKNQKVWVTCEFANHLYIRFKFRGKNRYVDGVIDKWATGEGYNPVIGEGGLKEIEVNESFFKRLKE